MQSIILVVLIILIIVIVSGSGFYFFYRKNKKVAPLEIQMTTEPILPLKSSKEPSSPETFVKRLLSDDCYRIFYWNDDAWPEASKSEVELLEDSKGYIRVSLKLHDDYEKLIHSIVNSRKQIQFEPYQTWMFKYYNDQVTTKVKEFTELYKIVTSLLQGKTARTIQDISNVEFRNTRSYINQSGVVDTEPPSVYWDQMISPNHFRKKWPFYDVYNPAHYSIMQQVLYPIHVMVKNAWIEEIFMKP